MKKSTFIICLSLLAALFLSCEENKDIPISFEDIEKYSIYDYIVQRPDSFSSFLQIMEKSGLEKTLSAYNPNGDGYTLFLPDNDAIQAFLDENPNYENLEQLMNDEEFLWYFSRYHVVNMEINANDFPFGALPEYTLTQDYLTVSFVIEQDSAYYKINNQAPVIRRNVEMSNGVIHIVSMALTPVTLTTYGWLSQAEGFSIFKAAVDTTGLKSLLNINPKVDEELLPLTLLLEHDSIFHKKGIYTITDLIDSISPVKTDYSSTLNPLYNFVAYHVLTENKFIDNLMEVATNYPTYSDIPLHINGLGVDIRINPGKFIYDTLIQGTDSVFINYIGINYDASNVLTQSGVIHFVDRVLKQQKPTVANQYYEIFDRPLFFEYAEEPGEYLIMDSTTLNSIRYSGTELVYVKMDEEEAPVSLWSDDYVSVEGDFSISYTIPKLVQGNYTVYIQGDCYNSEGAVIEVFIDGKPIGGTFDLQNVDAGSATADNPFFRFELGEMNFLRYDSHTITVKSLIPGMFSWDYIQFEPL